ncbi:hypothetical protein GRI38_06030 [Altererythrobacter aurantiacus]|uniref:PepSY-associated TM region n=1 Tax=Parapontixanthobacter aurantiacus TaxID=1463599 RepID=A0A844ZCG4_9SPHN|nr:hypothetical protein [Parapontixanthobacter aurantiacus]MXO85585.1 hypothetical protein [Parapontixanthobacter aurantiacus]
MKSNGPAMQALAKAHIWLGWLIAVPLLMWTLSGLLMVARPIEEVRGNHLQLPVADRGLPGDAGIAVDLSRVEKPVKSVSIAMDGGLAITRITYMDDSVERFSESGRQIPALNEIAARALVGRRIVGGDRVESATLFPASDPAPDFRRPIAAWQVALEDGTHVYVGEETGDILAVRTRFWRAFDFAWALHIMDFETREDTSHPVLIIFAILAAIGVAIGTVLLFRRRRARPSAA